MHAAQVVCVVVFSSGVIVSCLIQEVVRSQLIGRVFGEQRVGWREFRNIFDWFGEGGMWRLHREYYPASTLRFWFAASVSAMLLAGVLGFVLQAYGVR